MNTETVSLDRHPVLVLPSREETIAMGKEEWSKFMTLRHEVIRRMADDPYNFGWEPLKWKFVDALFGFPCFDPRFENEIRARFGADWDWDRWAEGQRRAHGFPAPVKMVLINGGNRGGKSQYGGKRAVKLVYSGPRKTAWCFHNNRNMSVDYQMTVVNDHMPPGKKTQQIQDGRPEYITYKTATGFSGEKFITHQHSMMNFKWYTSDVKDIEGGEIDLAWCDEHVDSDRVHTLKMRIATRDGRILVTFTPTEGYTETVRMFQHGADHVRSMPAFLLPDDDGPPLPWLALGFPDEAAWRKAQLLGPNSIPVDCHAWIQGGTGHPPVPAGRRFKKIPVVMRCMGEMEAGRLRYPAAVVFFHSSDNPFGNPEVVYRNCMGKSAAFIKERFYGLAEKTAVTRFPKFDEKVHVVAPDAIPAQGSNYCFCDPSNGRNFVFLWIRVVKDAFYVYREWPGNYTIPGVGLPGPWAEIDGKKFDGRKGPAQNPFGFDLAEHKTEIARLEQWDLPESADILTCRPGPATKEKILERYIDARAGNATVQTASETSTLIDQMNSKLHMDWQPVKLVGHNSILGADSAIHLINDALFYRDERPIDFTNRPKLYVSAECQNLIFAMKVWTGVDGNKGACKDFIDLLRYAYAQDLQDLGHETYFTVKGGGSY